MLIPPNELKSIWNLSCDGVLHVGAHTAEEASAYENAGWGHITWVECQPNLVKNLRERLDFRFHTVIEATIFDENGIKLSLHISNNSQSSSLLEFGTHRMDYPEIQVVKNLPVSTTRLDSLLDKQNVPNFINIDIQGVELKALYSLGDLIDKIEYIYCEVNRFEVYLGCDIIGDIDIFLKTKGFKHITTRWHWLQGWGDALYVRTQPDKSLFQVIKGFMSSIQFYKPQVKQVISYYLKDITKKYLFIN